MRPLLATLVTLSLLADISHAQTRPASPASQPAKPPGLILRLGATDFSAPPAVSTIRFSPDGKRLVAPHLDQSLRIWDLEQATTAVNIQGRGALMMADFIGNDRIAASGLGQTLEIFDSRNGTLLRTIRVPAYVRFFAVAPNGSRLVTVGDRILLWDPDTARRLADLGPAKVYNSQPIHTGVQFSGDGKVLVTIDETGHPKLWDALSGAPLPMPAEIPPTEENRVSISSDAGEIAIHAGFIRLFNLKTGKELNRPPQGEYASSLNILLFAPVGRMLAYDSKNKVCFWDVAIDRASLPIDVGGPIRSFSWSPDGKLIAVNPANQRFKVFSVADQRPLRGGEGHSTPVTAGAIAPGGRQIVTGDSKGNLIQWDGTTGKVLAERPSASNATNSGLLEYDLEGKLLYHCFYSNGIQVFDARELKHRWGSQTSGYGPVTLSADRSLLAQATNTHNVVIVRVREGTEVKQLQGDGRYVGGLAFSPDGERLAVSHSRLVQIWEVKTGKVLRILADRGRELSGDVAWSSDGGCIAVADPSGVTAYDPGSGAKIWNAGITPAYGVNFTPDGQLLAVWSASGVSILDRETGGTVALLAGHEGRVHSVAFEGPLVLTTGVDCTALLWDLRLVLKDTSLSVAAEIDLWRQLGSASSREAYRAAIALLARPDVLLARAQAAFITTDDAQLQRYRQLIAQLSSDDGAARERAHLELERAGPAAAVAIAQAMRSPPAGEAGARLASLAKLINVLDAGGDELAVKRQRARALQLVEWLGDDRSRQLLLDTTRGGVYPGAKAALARVDARRAAATQPSTLPATQP